MASLEGATKDLRQLLAADASAPEWRWNLRRRLTEVRNALSEPAPPEPADWLAPREAGSQRCRRQLQARVAALGGGVLDRLDTQALMDELRRLELDLEHYLQRLHDLVYDSVALELGGSE